MAQFEFHPGVVAANARRLYSRFGGAFKMFNLFYSVKTNWHPLVIRELHATGGYFEITSLMEWNKVAAFKPSRVVVNGPAKSAKLISEILASGVQDLILNIDNDTDLERVELFTSLSPNIRLGVRVFLDDKDVWTRFGYNVDSVLSNTATSRILRNVMAFIFISRQRITCCVITVQCRRKLWP